MSVNLGIDRSGKNNHWTVTGATTAVDQMLDSPTNNFCTINDNEVMNNGVVTISEGNLKLGLADNAMARGNIMPESGKWYWEANLISTDGANGATIGICQTGYISGAAFDQNAAVEGYVYITGGVTRSHLTNGDQSYNGASWAADDIMAVAYDADNGTLAFLKNNAAQGTAYSSLSGAHGAYFTGYGNTANWVVNFGQDSSFAGTETAQGFTDENGIGDFFYAPPAGFLALCTENLPEPIVDPKNFFNTLTYTGDGSSRSITGVGFKPDFLWIKGTNYTFNHILSDVVRVAGRILYSDTTGAEADYGIASFDSDGWSMSGTMNAINENNRPYVAWCWKAGNANTSFSESGNNPGGTHRANVAAGFSIVSYTGTGAAGTVAHGLGAAPDLMLIKNRDVTDAWAVYYGDNTDYLILNTGAATADAATYWNDTSPSSTVFTVNTAHSVNADGEKYIAYCWRSIEGFSKVGSYVGNGANDGPFLNTGFRPAWCLFKGIDGTNSWRIFDNKRDVNNPNNKILYADTTAAEASTSHPLDFVSNGIKIRGQSADFNENTENHIYMAFAETPIKHSNPK